MANLANPRNGNNALNTIRDLLEKSKPKFAEVIPKHLSIDRLVRVAIAACSREPKLLLCTSTSLLNAVMQAAQLGLEPGGPLGDSYLVPYKDDCTLIVGYRGLINLARRSGQIVSIEAHVVYELDKFVCKYGLNPILEHEPDWSGDPGEMIAVYAVAKLKDGGTQCEVMTKTQIEKIRMRSAASKSDRSPWSHKDDYFEMARKTVVRRLCKYLPLTAELASALEMEGDESGDVTSLIDVTPTATPATKTDAVKAKLAAQVARAAPEAPIDEVDFETGPEEQARQSAEAKASAASLADTVERAQAKAREPGEEG